MHRSPQGTQMTELEIVPDCFGWAASRDPHACFLVLSHFLHLWAHFSAIFAPPCPPAPCPAHHTAGYQDSLLHHLCWEAFSWLPGAGWVPLHPSSLSALCFWLQSTPRPPRVLLISRIYLALAALGLCCRTWTFPSCCERGLLSSCIAPSGFSRCRAQALGHTSFSSCGPQALWPCSRWDLSSHTRSWTCVPCTGRWILNHWTTRKVQVIAYLLVYFPGCV